MIECKKSLGTTGFLLYDHFEKMYFLRVYDSTDKSKYKDYDLCADDIKVQIVDDFTRLLYDTDKARGKLDYLPKEI